MNEFEKKMGVLKEIGFSTTRAEQILRDENDPFWESIATATIVLSPEQFSTLFLTETVEAA